MYEVLNSFKWKPIPKFWKTQNLGLKNMKCMKNERLEAYQEKKNLKNLEKTFDKWNWSEMR